MLVYWIKYQYKTEICQLDILIRSNNYVSTSLTISWFFLFKQCC